MKRIMFFSVCLLTTFLIILLISQPATIVYYAKEEERQFWELVNESALQEGKFTDEPQEIVFVYRKKRSLFLQKCSMLSIQWQSSHLEVIKQLNMENC